LENQSCLDHTCAPFGFVVSSGQRILAHREDRYEFPSPDSDLATIPVEESFRRLIRQWGQFPTGTACAVDFSTGQPARFVFARVPAAGWTLVLVIE
jgi:hypothetical protein